MGIKGSKMKKYYSELKQGMKKDEVLSILGQPDSLESNGDGTETYGWYSREFKGMFRGGFLERTITVKFKDDEVVGLAGNNINASAW